MNVLVDTSVWSLALRRDAPHGTAEERELVELIREDRVVLLGPVSKSCSRVCAPPSSLISCAAACVPSPM